jgi:hypothetical protein
VRSTALGAFERTHACSSTTVARSLAAPRSHAALQHHGRTQHPTVARSTPRSHAAPHGRTQPCSTTVARSLAASRSHAAPHVRTQPAAGPSSYLRSTARRAFERTHDSALAAIAVIRGRTCALRSTTNNWHVRTQVERSNALQ